MTTTSTTFYASRSFGERGDGKSRQRVPCIRCGIIRKGNPYRKGSGLCADCKAVDPTFGQPREHHSHT